MLAIAAGDRGDKAMHPSQVALVSPSFLKEILKCAVGDQFGLPSWRDGTSELGGSI